MELDKLKVDEMRSFSADRLSEVRKEIRQKLALARLAIYEDQKEKIKSKRNLRRTLARLLTIAGESRVRPQ